MEHLIGLADLVASSDKYIEVINYKNDLAEKLYQHLKGGKISCKDDAIKLFYDEINNSTIESFRIVSKRLESRLENSILSLRYKWLSSEALEAHIECSKKRAAMEILRNWGKRTMAMKIAESGIKKALRYQVTDYILSFSENLELHYATIIGDRKQYEKYAALNEKYSEIKRAEQLAQKYYCDLAFYFTKSKSKSQELQDKAQRYAEELQELAERVQSPRFILVAYNIAAIYYQLKNDYQALINTCNKAITYFESLPFSPPRAGLFLFLYQAIPALINLQLYEDAEVTINKCLKLLNKGNRNYMISLQYKMILGFHSGNYELCKESIELARPYLKDHANLSELWLIYEAYFNFFALLGKVDQNEKKYRLAKFLNEVPTFSMDKRGMNINIIIIQILFMLLRGRKGQIIDRFDALTNYASRYLKKGDTFRSNCFLKMLLTLPKCSFNRICVERKAAPFLEKLQSEPTSIAKQDHDIEIVPYEVLWGEVLKLIGN